jgi:hypothetical protein
VSLKGGSDSSSRRLWFSMEARRRSAREEEALDPIALSIRCSGSSLQKTGCYVLFPLSLSVRCNVLILI